MGLTSFRIEIKCTASQRTGSGGRGGKESKGIRQTEDSICERGGAFSDLGNGPMALASIKLRSAVPFGQWEADA
jgi:hypothetical protein